MSNAFHLRMPEIRLSQPAPRRIDVGQARSLQQRRTELAVVMVSSRDLDASKIGAIEMETGSNKVGNGVGGRCGYGGISLDCSLTEKN